MPSPFDDNWLHFFFFLTGPPGLRAVDKFAFLWYNTRKPGGEDTKKKRTLSRKKQKYMAEKTLNPKAPNVIRNAKDSVFCDLFEKPEYLIQLYRVLHPEDKKTQEGDLTIVTLSSVFLKEIYNDLGFMLGNRLIVLV